MGRSYESIWTEYSLKINQRSPGWSDWCCRGDTQIQVMLPELLMTQTPTNVLWRREATHPHAPVVGRRIRVSQHWEHGAEEGWVLGDGEKPKTRWAWQLCQWHCAPLCLPPKSTALPWSPSYSLSWSNSISYYQKLHKKWPQNPFQNMRGLRLVGAPFPVPQHLAKVSKRSTTGQLNFSADIL